MANGPVVNRVSVLKHKKQHEPTQIEDGEIIEETDAIRTMKLYSSVGGIPAHSTTSDDTLPASISEYRKITRPISLYKTPSSSGPWPNKLRYEGEFPFHKEKHKLAYPTNGWPSASHTPTAHSQSVMSTYGNATARPTDKIYHRSHFLPGVIFSSAWHQSSPARPEQVNPPTSAHTQTPVGQVCSKYRKFVVIKGHALGASACPIYTNGGKGCWEKKNTNEHISIRNEDEGSYSAPAENENGTLWATFHPSVSTGHASRWHRMTHKTAVLVTKLHTHPYNHPCTIIGYLGPESLALFEQKFEEAHKTVKRTDFAPPPDPNGPGPTRTRGKSVYKTRSSYYTGVGGSSYGGSRVSKHGIGPYDRVVNCLWRSKLDEKPLAY